MQSNVGTDVYGSIPSGLTEKKKTFPNVMKINLLVISHFLIGWTNISTSQVMMWI